MNDVSYLRLVEHAVFAHPDFNPNEYANAILAGESYPPQGSKTKAVRTAAFEPINEDVSVAISKLTFGIDDVEKQLKNVVSLCFDHARSKYCISNVLTPLYCTDFRLRLTTRTS